MKVLYAGDSPLGGSANYLLGILNFLRADVLHLAPAEILSSQHFKKQFDVIIFSDYSRDSAPDSSQKIVVEQVQNGAGFLMIGGWGSFTGLNGSWRNSLIEKLLPVRCLKKDDRRNFSSGALMAQNQKHKMFQSVNFKNAPILCGLNEVSLKKNSMVLLNAKHIHFSNSGLVLKGEVPLLVVDSNSQDRCAAFTCDIAPHWCGGMVDWGSKRMKLSVNSKIKIEVGDQYVRFFTALIHWLARKTN